MKRLARFLRDYDIQHYVEAPDPKPFSMKSYKKINKTLNMIKTTPKSATGYDSNLPSGLGEDPGEATETTICTTCDGDSVKDESDYCSTCESTGKLTEAGYPAHIN